ncbi:metalloregulator ArsR/SmtB family transcription factor [Marispirochaeta aestuarii]|uniref:ArsR/SmtB family transcription factor n=1 Tax=Marispirochaeta aestuarii TaxID=1963862 RepID=UPI0029C7CBB3|nr:metalloregulator ArsR/SmtB family transcription factor [Marispirochaeta aestuarii]
MYCTNPEETAGLPNMQRISELAGVLKALGHPSRLLIVEALGKEPHCVCELTAMIGADTSTVSKHLSLLKNAGVVRDEKRGNQVFYSLTCQCVIEAITHLLPLMEQKFQHYSEVMETSRT